MARHVGAALAERLKQPVVIENIAGGGGNNATLSDIGNTLAG